MRYPRVSMAFLWPSRGSKANSWSDLKAICFFQKNISCHSFWIRHSFRVTVIFSKILLSLFPNFCHSFKIIVISSVLLSFLPNYCHFKYLTKCRNNCFQWVFFSYYSTCLANSSTSNQPLYCVKPSISMSLALMKCLPSLAQFGFYLHQSSLESLN